MALPLAAREGTVGSRKPWGERQTSSTTTLILTITTTCTRVCLGHEATQSLNPLAVSSTACYTVVGLFFRTLLLALGPDVTAWRHTISFSGTFTDPAWRRQFADLSTSRLCEVFHVGSKLSFRHHSRCCPSWIPLRFSFVITSPLEPKDLCFQ